MKRATKVWAAVATLVGLPVAADEARVEPSAAELRAEQRAAEVHIPFSLSVVPGISINGLPSSNVVNNLSLGLVATHAGRLDGLAASLAANWVEREVRGLQTAIAFNMAGGEVGGGQLAVGLNVAGSRLTGLQGAVGLNVATANVQGLQASVGANVVAGDVRGLQVAVGANVAAADVQGLQASVGANVAAGHMVGLQTAAGLSYALSLQGAQVSILNVGGDVDGAQVGIINVAGRVSGLQLGLVNVAREAFGAPIGLVSLIGNGQFHVQAWSSDLALTNVGLKFGGKHIYTLLGVGYQPGGREERRWTSNVGVGGHIPLGRFYVDVDAVASSLYSRFLYDNDLRNLVAQLRLLGGLQLAPRFAVFGGITANTLVEWGEGELERLGNRFAWERTNGDTTVRVWPGLVAGVQL
ncbi:MAG: hypothetical protein L0Y66_03650 [Myxococcaceae bacterium]|nr:hypothetical protein [Myxococcaceae bacterium]MCI0668918.1 hypothetical protein [Myxococcaceae bacterium]